MLTELTAAHSLMYLMISASSMLRPSTLRISAKASSDSSWNAFDLNTLCKKEKKTLQNKFMIQMDITLNLKSTSYF